MSRPVGINSEDTKQFIVDVATKIFERKGYSATSMAEIKNETNLSKGSIYYHFKNKEELYLYCIEQVSKDFIRNWEITSQKEQSAESKLYLWARINSMMSQKPIINTIPEYLVSMNKENYEVVINLYEPEFDIVKVIVEEGKRSGEFKADLDVDGTAVILFNLISSLANADFFGYKSTDEQRYLYKLAIDIIFSGLKAPVI